MSNIRTKQQQKQSVPRCRRVWRRSAKKRRYRSDDCTVSREIPPPPRSVRAMEPQPRRPILFDAYLSTARLVGPAGQPAGRRRLLPPCWLRCLHISCKPIQRHFDVASVFATRWRIPAAAAAAERASSSSRHNRTSQVNSVILWLRMLTTASVKLRTLNERKLSVDLQIKCDTFCEEKTSVCPLFRMTRTIRSLKIENS